MATLPEGYSGILESLGYEPKDDDRERLRYRNPGADAEIEIVESAGQHHFDFSGFDMMGERIVMDDLILSEEVLTRMTEESRNGKGLVEGGPP